jgi:multiple sugar transport system substrate-binding protein
MQAQPRVSVDSDLIAQEEETIVRNSYLRLTLALAVVLALVACAGPTATPGATGPGATGTPAAQTPGTTPDATPGQSPDATQPPTGDACPAAAHGQRVEMWSPLTGPDGDEMTALAQRYSGENTMEITVEHVAQPDYVTALNAAAAGNQLPAMTVVRLINVSELASRNVVQPLSDEVLAILGDELLNDYPANVWDGGEWRGERYSIPLDMHPLVMYYNKDLFAAANVAEPGAEPWTLEEFEAAMTALDASGVKPMAIGTHFQGGALFQTLIRQYGGALTNEEGTEVTYDSEAGVQAMQRLVELQDAYSEDITGTGDPEVQEFQSGRAAIVMHGPWHISNMLQLDFAGFAPVPQMGGTEYAVWGGSHQLAITSSDPAVQAAAACWIRWLSENSVEWGAAGQVPARTSQREDPQLADVAPPIAAIAASGDNVIILPQVPEIEHALWGLCFGPVVDAVLTGQETDIQGALERAADVSQQTIDENATRYEP